MTIPHDPPSAAQLLEALRELEATPPDGDRARFLERVSANARAIAEREVVLGPRHEAAHRERLARLGFADDRALAHAIRSGKLDERYDEIASMLRETTRDKLAVANPAYLRD